MIIIDYSDKRPIYEQIVERFQALILNGVMEADEKLPSVRSLAMELSINPNTIQRAYAELERDGYIYTVKGRGNFVRENKDLKLRQQEKLLNKLEELTYSCLQQGIDGDKLLEHVKKIVEEVKR